MKILVTGGAGFIGSQLAKWLQSHNHAVTVVSQTKRGPGFIQADLMRDSISPEELACFDAIVHMAWVTKHGEFWTSELNQKWRVKTVELFKSYQRAGGRYFLGLGTCAEYDWSLGRLCANDNKHLNPSTLYGIEKLACYRELLDLSQSTKLGWARLFFPFGPGENRARIIPSMILSHLEQRELVIKNPYSSFDFIGVQDVAGVLGQAVEKQLSRAFNVGSGSAVSLSSIAEKLNEYFRRSDVIRWPVEPSRGVNQSFYADLSELIELNISTTAMSFQNRLLDYCEFLKGETKNEDYN